MSKARTSGWWIRLLFAAVSLSLCAAVVIYGVTRPKAPEKSPPIGARLELAAGEVKVDQDGDGAGEPERAVSGTALRVGAVVTTSEGARALVRLPDGSSCFLRGGSSLTLDADAVRASAGEYWLDVPELERDPLVHRLGEVSVTAAASGLSIKKTEQGASVYVARGMAIVTAPGGRVEVRSGEQAVITGGDAPKISAVAFWDDWTGGMADFDALTASFGPGSGTIYGVDFGALAGSPAEPLQIKRQSVRAVLREGLSETEVDQTFFNPSPRPVEGWYWFVLPEGASVTGFAVETDGVLVDGEFIERKEAAAKYTAAVASGHAPAILEWIDGKSYRARIYPVPAAGTRRVVLRYLELRSLEQGKLSYVYPMGRGAPTRIGELSLSVDLGDGGAAMEIATLDDARIEEGGRRVTMRRSGYTPRADFQLEAKRKDKPTPLTVARFETGADAADYVMARYTPDVEWAKLAEPRADVVVVVDTSAAGDEASRQLKASTAEAILRALSKSDRFALVSLDVRPTVLHPKEGLAGAEDKDIATALERLAEHASGGATDMAAMFDAALSRVHAAEQPAVIYVGDGLATSGEMSGEQLIERLRRALGTSRARLFTMGVGAGADTALLGELARAGSGISLSVQAQGEATSQALELVAAVKVPTITDFELDLGAGLDEPLMNVSGKVSRGNDVILLARTHHDLPSKAMVRGRVAGEPFEKEVEITKDKSVVTAFVPRLWAGEQMRRLLGAAAGPEAERGRIAALGIEYGLVTPFTSILALESESAYSRMGIPRRASPLRGVRLGALDVSSERRLAAHLTAGEAPRVWFACSRSGGPEALEEQAVAPSPVPAGAQAPPPAFATAATETVPTEPKDRADAPAPPAAATPQDAEERGGGDDLPKSEAPAKSRSAPDRDVAPRPQSPGPMGSVSPAAVGGRTPLKPWKAQEAEMLSRLRNKPAGNEDASGEKNGKAEDKRAEALKGLDQKRSATWRPTLATCSDLARRPLGERMVMWKKRLATVQSEAELVGRYDAAQSSCELGDWHAEREFLRLMQQRVVSEAGARLVLAHFAGRPDVQTFVAKSILRRTVDDRIVGAIESTLFGAAVDWAKIDRELSAIESPEERIDALREAMARAPDDPQGQIRMVELLAEVGRAQEALALGRRLRDQGLLTLKIALQLGDVLARQKLEDEAVRTYSEIVEFDPTSLTSRVLLGDIYLGRGWYEPAYRQFKTATDAAPDEALTWLRLAMAAAGSGRIDEALRLERKVTSAQGRPGPTDPRHWARLLSAARIARLIAEPPKEKAPSKASLEREIKELGLFGAGPASLVILTWEDLRSDLLLVTEIDEQAVAIGDPTDAALAGMSAVLLSPPDRTRATLVTRLRSLPRRDEVALLLTELSWDGSKLEVKLSRYKLAPGETRVVL